MFLAARGYYLFESFKDYNCIAGFSRDRLNLGFQNNPDLKKNRESFLRTIGIKPDDLVCLKQVHGKKIFLAKDTDKGQGAVDYNTAIADCDGIITREKGMLFLDLIKVNSQQLLSAGVLEKNISDSQICTSCQNEDFFSYRKEGQSAGRMMSVIMVK